MTKKDYELIAHCIKVFTDDMAAQKQPLSEYQAKYLVAVFSNYIKAAHPRFDMYKFMSACGIQD
jgi:hypothetical protein